MVSSFCFYSFFSFFNFFLLFFIWFFHIIIYHFLLSLFFFFLPHTCLYSIITSLYACHHFSEPKLYIGPYFLQVFLLLLCFSVFVFCFVIKYSQFCIFPLGVLENTLHFSLCFFLLFPLFLFSAFQCYFVVLHQTLLATLLLFFPMSWSLHCGIWCISSCCSFSLCISVFFAVHFFQAPSLTRSLFTVWVCRFTFPVELGWHTCFQSAVTCA